MNLNLLSASFNLYGLLIGVGLFACIFLAFFHAKKRGYYEDLVFEMAIVCVPLAIVGARLYYIIFDIIANDNASSWTFAKIIGLQGGLRGLAIYGGVIGGMIGGVALWLFRKYRYESGKSNKQISFLQMADLAFSLFLLGQAIGRWGNFFNQEAYGNPVTDPNLQWFPYAVYIDAANGYYQATFFYESMWNIIGFALLQWLYAGKRKSFDGFVLYGYFIWYGMGRMFIEGLRSDSLWLVPDVIRVSQLLSAILLFFGLAMIIVHIVQAKRHGKEPFILVPINELNDEYYGFDKSVFSRKPENKPAEKKSREPQFDEVDDNDRYWEIDQNSEDKK